MGYLVSGGMDNFILVYLLNFQVRAVCCVGVVFVFVVLLEVSPLLSSPDSFDAIPCRWSNRVR